eukprot:TRINITY_DN21263_c0_g2_i2.p4 TRINITY_DN21263_c0_g2~~TRINITY_DN21263_c0_g2_i2.p4  ORF type:complete len:153 (+),score=0.60 TRINITY_DN21263_c0_g2_i2:325-783(+)
MHVLQIVYTVTKQCNVNQNSQQKKTVVDKQCKSLQQLQKEIGQEYNFIKNTKFVCYDGDFHCRKPLAFIYKKGLIIKYKKKSTKRFRVKKKLVLYIDQYYVYIRLLSQKLNTKAQNKNVNNKSTLQHLKYRLLDYVFNLLTINKIKKKKHEL